jgi:NAD(P)-dependent dehydrogenase (short-subunit alcohol dehydrogenase family)
VHTPQLVHKRLRQYACPLTKQNNHALQVHNIARRPCDVPDVVNHLFDLSLPHNAQAAAARLTAALAPPSRNPITPAEQRVITIIHNASTHHQDTIHTLDHVQMTEALNLSVVSPCILTRSLIGQMKSGSSIIFIGSTLSEKAVKDRVSYVTAKHATVGIMRSYTQELFGTGIHTACICPGFTDTPMLRAAMSQPPATQASSELSQDARNFIHNFVSVRRLLSPEEVCLLLCMCVCVCLCRLS